MSNIPEQDKQGRFIADVSDEVILKSVRDHEPAGTAEVGEAVGLARQNADYRLRQLHENGQIDKKLVGNSLVWTVSDGGNV